ncbi:MAG: hypothetical protein KJ896_00485, partial [Nanoarchaeota archaeon]|nr:hypothetical protein [Nanoarchaeota archaeon]
KILQENSEGTEDEDLYQLPVVLIPELIGKPFNLVMSGTRCLLTKKIQAPTLMSLCNQIDESDPDYEIAKEFIQQCRFKVNELRALLAEDTVEHSSYIPRIKTNFKKNFIKNLVECLDNIKGDRFSEEEKQALRFAATIFDETIQLMPQEQYCDWTDTNVLIKGYSNYETLEQFVEEIKGINPNNGRVSLREVVRSFVNSAVEIHKVDFNKTNRLVHPLEDSRKGFAKPEKIELEQFEEDVHYLLCRERVKRKIVYNQEKDYTKKMFLRGPLRMINELIISYEKGNVKIVDNFLRNFDINKPSATVNLFLDKDNLTKLLDDDAYYLEIHRYMRSFRLALTKYLIMENPDIDLTEHRQRWVTEINVCLSRTNHAVSQIIRKLQGEQDYDNLKKNIEFREHLFYIKEALNKLENLTLEDIDFDKLQEQSLVDRIESQLKSEIQLAPEEVVKSLDPHIFSVRSWYIFFDPDASEAEQIAALMHDYDRFFGKQDKNRQPSYSQYKSDSAGVSASRSMEWLEEHYNLSTEILEEILYYITYHDDKEKDNLDQIKEDIYNEDWYANLRVLHAADCASYMEDNFEDYIMDNGTSKTHDKLSFMYNHLEEEHKIVLSKLHKKCLDRLFYLENERKDNTLVTSPLSS